MGGTEALIIGSALGIGGGIMSFFGQQSAAGYYDSAAALAESQTLAEADTLRRQAAIVEQNALLYQHEAAMADILGEFNEIATERDLLGLQEYTEQAVLDIKRAKNVTMAAQVTGYNKSGVTLEGTPSLVIRETARLAEEDIAKTLHASSMEEINIRQEGALTALGFAMEGVRATSSEYNTLAQAGEMYRGSSVSEAMAPYAGLQYQAQGTSARWGSYSSLLTSMGNTSMLYGRSYKG